MSYKIHGIDKVAARLKDGFSYGRDQAAQRLDGQFVSALEFRAKWNAGWRDDSGSARDSITAYVVGMEPHTKNFSAGPRPGGGLGSAAYLVPGWAAAQQPGFTSPIHGNTSDNFLPVAYPMSIGDDPKGVHVVLTMFIGYGGELEEQFQTIERTSMEKRDAFVGTCAAAFKDALRYIGTRF